MSDKTNLLFIDFFILRVASSINVNFVGIPVEKGEKRKASVIQWFSERRKPTAYNFPVRDRRNTLEEPKQFSIIMILLCLSPLTENKGIANMQKSLHSGTWGEKKFVNNVK